MSIIIVSSLTKNIDADFCSRQMTTVLNKVIEISVCVGEKIFQVYHGPFNFNNLHAQDRFQQESFKTKDWSFP